MAVFQIEVTEDRTGRKRLMAVVRSDSADSALKGYLANHPYVLKTCSVSAKKVA